MGTAPRLLVGLGNPTEAYHNTRHNVGRRFVEYLLDETDSTFTKSRQAEVFRLPAFFNVTLDQPLICVRLSCFMNQSGPDLKRVMDKESIGPDQVLVAIDDFMIPFGSLRLRTGGSSGGHNGVKSIIETLQTEEFPRIRFGIGPVPTSQDPADFVLKKFSKEEQGRLPSLFAAAKDGLKVLFADGYDRSMSFMNKNHLAV